MAVIQPPDWLTKEFLQNAMRTGLKDDSLVVIECNIKPALPPGDNFASIMLRATLTLKRQNKNEETLPIIVKLLPKAQFMSESMDLVGFFRKEAKMFMEVLPQMQRLLEAQKPGHYPKVFADCYFYQENPNTVIILQDLSTEGFTIADRQLGLDRDHVTLVLKSVARYHACTHYIVNENPKLKEIFNENLFTPKSDPVMKPMVDSGFEQLIETGSTWDEMPSKYLEKLKVLSNDALPELYKKALLDPGKFNTLLHGDLWNSNIMFKYEEGKVVGLKFVDFQIANYNSVSLDLNYFLFSSSTNQVREELLEQMLEIYHKELVDILKLIGDQTNYPFEQFQKEFYDLLSLGLIMHLIFFPFLAAPKEKSSELSEFLDKGTKLKDALGYSIPRVRSSIVKLMPFFEKHDVL